MIKICQLIQSSEIIFSFRRKLLFLDFEPDTEENKYEKFSLHELETLLSSLNKEEELEIQKIKEKYHRQQLLQTRALRLKRPSESNNSCPNIRSRCIKNTILKPILDGGHHHQF